MGLQDLSLEEIDNYLSQPTSGSGDINKLSIEEIDKYLGVQESKPATKPAVNQAAPKQTTTNINNPTPQPTTNIPKSNWLDNATTTIKSKVADFNKQLDDSKQKMNEDVKARAKEKLRKRAEWEQKHPFISGIQKDYQLPTVFTGGNSYRGQVPQWELEAKYGLDIPAKEQIKGAAKTTGLNLVAPVNIGVDYATGGKGKIAKQGLKEAVKQGAKQLAKTGGIGATVQGITSSLADNGISKDLLIRPLQYGTLGVLGGTAVGGLTPILAKGGSNAVKVAGKAKDKVVDAITSTDVGAKALQAAENAKTAVKNTIDPAIKKAERTFKQHMNAKKAKAEATKPQEVIENMPEASGRPVEVETGINTPETNLTHVNEAPTSSNIPDGMAERGTVSKLRELGIDTSDLPEDVRLYEKKTYQDTKRQLDALTPEERAILVKDGNTSSDVSNLAMIEDIKSSLEKGEMPYELLNRYTKAGTEQARTLQSRSYLTNTPEGSLAALHKAMQDVTPGVKTLQEQSKELTEAFLKGDKRAVNNIIKKAGLGFNKNKSDFIDDLNYLKENNLLNENEVAKAVEDRFSIGKVTREDYDNFVDMYNKLYQLPNGSREYEVQKALIGKYIADKLPVSWGQKVKTLRNMGWLLNFKTTERNLLGNTFFNVVEKGIVDPLAAGIDKGLSLFTGERTRVLPQYKELMKGLWNGIRYGIDDVNRGINTKGGVNLSGRYDLHPNTFRWHSWKDIKGVWKNSKNVGDAIAQEASMMVDNALHPFEKLLGYELQAADRAFYQAAYEESIANQMKAMGLKKPTDAIRKIANEEALESVFQNNSALSNGLAKIKKGLNDFVHKGDVGLGDLTIPYVQTPANIGTQAINYSPIGFLKAFYKGIKTGNQRNFSKDLSRAIVGTTGAYGTGKAIKDAGYKIIGKPENYDKEYKNDIAMGKQYEAIEAPDGTSYSYTNLDPASSVIRNAANLGEAIKLATEEEGINKAKAVLPLLKGAIQPTADMLSDTADVFDELKNVSQKDDVVGLADLVGSKIVDSASSGLARNIANSVDDYQRETRGRSKTETSINKLKASSPLRTSLPVKYDTNGQPVKTGNLAQEMFIPIKVNKKSTDKLLNDIDTLGKTNSAFYMPNVTNKVTFKKGEEEVTETLNAQQLSDYQRSLGQVALTVRYRLLDGKDASKMSDLEKEDIARQIQAADSAAKQLIASDMFGGNIPDPAYKTKKGPRFNKKKAGTMWGIGDIYNEVKQQEQKQAIKEKRKRLNKRAKGN